MYSKHEILKFNIDRSLIVYFLMSEPFVSLSSSSMSFGSDSKISLMLWAAALKFPNKI